MTPLTAPTLRSDDVLRFWFRECDPKQWWRKDPAFDAQIAARFATLHARAAQGELFSWRGTAQGRLAEILVLDQFSRNLYRDDARAFAQDAQALVLAQEAVGQGLDAALQPIERGFLYLPYMHSESLLIHEEALRLFVANDLTDNLDFERRHLAILQRFGRYPHRNALLGRPSTPEEAAFLREPGSSF